MEKKTEFGVTGNILKLIAMITMVVDHAASGIYERYLIAKDIVDFDLYMILREVGRMAFPIYCFLLVEGYFHTRNVKKYVLRLLVLAVISEYPYDVAVNPAPSIWGHCNVIFTLLIGLILVWVIDLSRKNSFLPIANDLVRRLVAVGIYLGGCALAYFMRTDYGMVGVATVVIMYCLRGEDRFRRILAFSAGVLILTLGCGVIEAYAFLMIVPIAFYNGKRGSNSPVIRYAFNTFYPVHLTIIAIVAYSMGLM